MQSQKLAKANKKQPKLRMPSQARCTPLGWVFFIWIALLAAPTSTNAQGWKEINATESPIYFANKQVIKYLGTGWSENYSSKRYLINAETSPGPRGMVFMSILAPNYFFSTISTPIDVASQFNFLKNNTNIVGSQKSHTHPLLIRYVLAKNGLRDCILFVGKSGQGGGDGQTSEGTSVVKGYYCSDPDEGMTEVDLLRVVDQIGTKQIGDPAPEPRMVHVEKTEQPKAQNGSRAPSIEKKLGNLKALWEKNLITKEDYDRKRKEILDKSFK